MKLNTCANKLIFKLLNVSNNDFMLELTDQKWNYECNDILKQIRYFNYRIDLLKEHFRVKSKLCANLDKLY